MEDFNLLNNKYSIYLIYYPKLIKYRLKKRSKNISANKITINKFVLADFSAKFLTFRSLKPFYIAMFLVNR